MAENMKKDILDKLLNAEDYISGQELCDTFQVSRTAVWKHINSLKEEGYVIDSVNRKGYRLLQSPDLITPEVIERYLKTSWIGREIHFYEETDSTNIRAKAFGEENGTDGLLCIAEQQTGGKGRRGRAWVSPKGSGIWMSLLLRPAIRPENASMLTLVAAMAIAKSLEQVPNITFGIKWPNDIIVNQKKVCGILTEMNTEIDYINYVVVGIGVNVNTEEFTDEIAAVATSLKVETGASLCRAKIAADILNAFEAYYAVFVETGDLSNLMEVYESRLINKGQMVRVIEGSEERVLKAIGIDERGALLVENEQGDTEKIIAGEVSVRGILGYV